MLEELRRITSVQPYKSRGGILVKEISITPWDDKAKFVFEVFEDDEINTERQLWEVVCNGLRFR
jgi:hypothetical protein